MDQEVQSLALKLADATVRNTAGSIADKIGALKAKKRDQETISELEEIVNNLVSDKSELIRIAQAYEAELVAQRISDDDIQYITQHVVPLIEHLASRAQGATSPDKKAQETIDLLKPLLSAETVKILQLLGFNFRQALGEPLTDLVNAMITSKSHADPASSIELQRLALERDNGYLSVAQDPEAFARLHQLMGK